MVWYYRYKNFRNFRVTLPEIRDIIRYISAVTNENPDETGIPCMKEVYHLTQDTSSIGTEWVKQEEEADIRINVRE